MAVGKSGSNSGGMGGKPTTANLSSSKPNSPASPAPSLSRIGPVPVKAQFPVPSPMTMRPPTVTYGSGLPKPTSKPTVQPAHPTAKSSAPQKVLADAAGRMSNRLAQAEHLADGMADATQRLKAHQDFTSQIKAKAAEAANMARQPTKVNGAPKPATSISADLSKKLDQTTKMVVASPKGEALHAYRPPIQGGVSGHMPGTDIGLVATAAALLTKDLINKPKVSHKKIK